MKTTAFHLETSPFAVSSLVGIGDDGGSPEFYFVTFDLVTGDCRVHGLAGELPLPFSPLGDTRLDTHDEERILAAATSAVILAIYQPALGED